MTASSLMIILGVLAVVGLCALAAVSMVRSAPSNRFIRCVLVVLLTLELSTNTLDLIVRFFPNH